MLTQKRREQAISKGLGVNWALRNIGSKLCQRTDVIQVGGWGEVTARIDASHHETHVGLTLEYPVLIASEDIRTNSEKELSELNEGVYHDNCAQVLPALIGGTFEDQVQRVDSLFR